MGLQAPGSNQTDGQGGGHGLGAGRRDNTAIVGTIYIQIEYPPIWIKFLDYSTASI